MSEVNLAETTIGQVFVYEGVELVTTKSLKCLDSGCHFDLGSGHKGSNCLLIHYLSRGCGCGSSEREDSISVIFLPYAEWAKRRLKGEL